jgi:hypothetical protein
MLAEVHVAKDSPGLGPHQGATAMKLDMPVPGDHASGLRQSRSGRSKLRLLLFLKGLATVVGLLVAYLALDMFTSYRMAPPSLGCTVAELAAKLPPPRRLAVIATPAGKRMIWLGDTPWWVVRSGPPCYVFDARGRLVEWCHETGEGWHSDGLAMAAWQAKPITMDEALQWCEPPGREVAAKKN